MVEKNKTANKTKADSEKKAPTEGGKNARLQKNKNSSTDFSMTLDEFCTRLSQDNTQVELIGGFYAHEKHATSNTERHGMDTQINFKVRFDTFCQQPVTS